MKNTVKNELIYKLTLVVVFLLYLPLFAWTEEIALSPDGKYLYSSCYSEIDIYDAGTGEKIRTIGEYPGFRAPGYKISTISISPDGKRLAVRYKGGIVMWDIENFIPLWTIEAAYGEYNACFAFSPDNQRIAYRFETEIGDDPEASWRTLYSYGARIAGVEDGKPITTLFADASEVNAITYSPDGRQIATGFSEHKIKIFDAITGRELFELSGHEDIVNTINYSPDGTKIVTGSGSYSGTIDNTVKVWNLANRQVVLTLPGNGEMNYSAVFSPDGSRIAAVFHRNYSTTAGNAFIYDAITGNVLLSFRANWFYTTASLKAFFTNDGKNIWNANLLLNADNGQVIRNIRIRSDNEM